MATDPNYILATNLQHYFVDKDTGLPLAGGIISFWRDTNRTIPKPVFAISGSPPNYTFVELPNPIELSGVGTIQDNSGNDILEYYYPYILDGNGNLQVDLYYISATDSLGVPQWTREGFPADVIATTPITGLFGTNNLIVNGAFDFNGGNVAPVNSTSLAIAPGASAGLLTPDILFKKNVIGAVDNIEFIATTFSDPVQSPDPTPEYYFEYNCTTIQAGETLKELLFYISSNALMLQGQNITFSLQGRSSDNSGITVHYLQYFGDPAPATPPVDVTVGAIPLQPGPWVKYNIPFTIPSTGSPVFGTCGNQYNAISIQFPVQATCNIQLTNIQLVIGDKVIPFPVIPEDEIAAQVYHPRTAEIKMSLRPIEPGWVNMNDGTIGSPTSGATNRANIDTFPLYYYLYTYVTDMYAPVVGGRGVNVYSDFSANKPITLTKALGRAMAGVNPTGAIIYSQTINEATDVDPVSDLISLQNITGQLFTGDAVQVTSTGVLPTPLMGPPTVYYVIVISSTTIKLAATIDDAQNGIPIDITATFSGSMTIATVNAATVLGEYLGQETHAQTVPELISHNHSIIILESHIGGVSAFSAAGNIGPFSQDTNPTGGSTPFNIMQPTTYMNVYIKL